MGAVLTARGAREGGGVGAGATGLVGPDHRPLRGGQRDPRAQGCAELSQHKNLLYRAGRDGDRDVC